MKERYIITQSDDTQINPFYYAWMDSSVPDVKFTDSLSKATTFHTAELAEKTKETIIKIMHSKRVYDCSIEVVVHPDDAKKSETSAAPVSLPPESEQSVSKGFDFDGLVWKKCSPDCGLIFEVATDGNRVFYRYKEPDGTVGITLEDGKAVNGMYCARLKELRDRALEKWERKRESS